jgi:hypothetical protein
MMKNWLQLLHGLIQTVKIRPIQLEPNKETVLGCTTCAAMCGSGHQTGLVLTTISIVKQLIHWGLSLVNLKCCEVVAGSMGLAVCDVEVVLNGYLDWLMMSPVSDVLLDFE